MLVICGVDTRIEGEDLPPTDLDDSKRGILGWGPLSVLLDNECLRGRDLVVPGLKNLKTDDKGKHWGGWISCLASSAGSETLNV